MQKLGTRSLCTAVAWSICASGATAAVSPGLYVGGEFGQSNVAASVSNYFEQVELSAHRSAFQVVAGIRPIPYLGAEIGYLDLGHPGGTLFDQPVSVSMHGESAYGVAYLPVRLLDLFAKAGVARIQTRLGGLAEVCKGTPCPFIPVGLRYHQLDWTDTAFCAGGGAQAQVGQLAVRAEYTRFTAAGEHPSLASVGVTWTLW
jgi:hypothetical protein